MFMLIKDNLKKTVYMKLTGLETQSTGPIQTFTT